MAGRKQNLKNILQSVKDVHDVQNSWTDTYSELFEPNDRNLFKLHKIHKLKRRFAANY